MKSLSHTATSLMLTSLSILPLIAQSTPEGVHNDLINFENGDILHGHFLGFTTSGKIIWKNDFAENNIAFDKSEARKVVLNKGELTTPFTHTSFVKLKNDDVIPGKIISMNNDELTIETDFSGTLEIPVKLITHLEINPHGNQIIYRGPYAEETKWEIKYPDQYNPNKDDDIDKKNEEDNDDEAEKVPDAWQLKNFSLQHKGDPSSIILKDELPEIFRITFSSYTYSYYPTITFFTDLNVPEFDKENEDVAKNRKRFKTTVGSYLGSGLVLRSFSSGASLTHFNYLEDGIMTQNVIKNEIRSSSNINTPIKKFYDLRVDKTKGIVILYSNKKHIGQWQIKDIADKLQGKNFGFSIQHSRSSTLSIVSDLVISQWNGVTDSARSLELETRDIVMLENGTDRYSGEIISITDKIVDLKTAYAELAIPHNQISSINLATEKFDLTEEETSHLKNSATVRFYGTGKITGKISKAEEGYVAVETRALGIIKIKSEYISSFEFADMELIYEASAVE